MNYQHLLATLISGFGFSGPASIIEAQAHPSLNLVIICKFFKVSIKKEAAGINIFKTGFRHLKRAL